MSTLIILSDYSLNTPSRFTGPYVNPLTPPLINVITINFVFEYYDTTSVNFHKNSGIQNWTPVFTPSIIQQQFKICERQQSSRVSSTPRYKVPANDSH